MYLKRQTTPAKLFHRHSLRLRGTRSQSQYVNYELSIKTTTRRKIRFESALLFSLHSGGDSKQSPNWVHGSCSCPLGTRVDVHRTRYFPLGLFRVYRRTQKSARSRLRSASKEINKFWKLLKSRRSHRAKIVRSGFQRR